MLNPRMHHGSRSAVRSKPWTGAPAPKPWAGPQRLTPWTGVPRPKTLGRNGAHRLFWVGAPTARALRTATEASPVASTTARPGAGGTAAGAAGGCGDGTGVVHRPLCPGHRQFAPGGHPRASPGLGGPPAAPPRRRSRILLHRPRRGHGRTGGPLWSVVSAVDQELEIGRASCKVIELPTD